MRYPCPGRLALLLALLIAAPASASAADTFFGSTNVFHSAPVTAFCRVYNAGSSPVKITSAGMVSYVADAPPIAPLTDTCTTAPLQPQRACLISASLDAYAGGFVMVKGSTKKLRGDCGINLQATGTLVAVMPMR